MAERYQERPYLAADYDRGDPHGAGRGESDPLAELARLIGQTDPSGLLPSRPRIRCSRARIFARSTTRPSNMICPRKSTALRRARRHGCSAPGMNPRRRRRRRTTTTSRNTSRRRCIPCIATARSDQQPQAPAQDYDEQPQYADAEPQQDPSRYDDALYGRIESGEQDYQRDPAYPDDPYAYQNGYERRARAEEALERADDGCRRAGAGRGGDGRCLCLSHLCRFAPQRRAADHQGRQQPDQGGAGPVRWWHLQDP